MHKKEAVTFHVHGDELRNLLGMQDVAWQIDDINRSDKIENAIKVRFVRETREDAAKD